MQMVKQITNANRTEVVTKQSNAVTSNGIKIQEVKKISK